MDASEQVHNAARMRRREKDERGRKDETSGGCVERRRGLRQKEGREEEEEGWRRTIRVNDGARRFIYLFFFRIRCAFVRCSLRDFEIFLKSSPSAGEEKR